MGRRRVVRRRRAPGAEARSPSLKGGQPAAAPKRRFRRPTSHCSCHSHPQLLQFSSVRAELQGQPDAPAAREPRALYGFQGFKVWIGSLCASADTLISDGSDNAIIQHTFDRDAEARAPVDPSLERRG